MVSIITVCLNSEKYLERTIKSVLSQTFKDIEYIIIDGGSTDGTKGIIERYREHISGFISEPDKGIYDAMNKGVRMAKGEFIYFLHSDDYLCQESAMRDLVDAFEKNGRADFIYGDMKFYDVTAGSFKPKVYADIITKQYFIYHCLPPSTMYRKSCFDKAGYFDIDLKICADIEWFLRALFRKRLRTAHARSFVLVHQTSGISNNPASQARIAEEKSRIRKSYFNFLELAFGDTAETLFRSRRLQDSIKTVLGEKFFVFLKKMKARIS